MYTYIYIYIYNYIIYTLEVQCLCLPTSFYAFHSCRSLPAHVYNVDVYSSMSMFTLETCGAANLSFFARSLSWTCFISQTHAISLWITCDTDFPKGSCFVSLNGTYVFAWERVFCPRSPQTQSWKQNTPWERCFNKGQPRNLDSVGIRMTRLVTQTRKKTHYILGVAWGGSFPRVNITFHW